MELLEAWLILRSVRGLSDGTICTLVRHFGGPKEVLAASSAELRHVAGLRSSVVTALRQAPDSGVMAHVRQEMHLIEQGACSVVTMLDAAYPHRLAMIPDPPPVLYVRGTLPPTGERAVAIVGSRRASPSGALMTQELSQRLGEMGFTIVSGLARGIDAAAHRGALAAKAKTIPSSGVASIERIPPNINNYGGTLKPMAQWCRNCRSDPRRCRTIFPAETGLSAGCR